MHLCIYRLCTLTLKRLVLTRPLGSDLGSVVIAVKMQVRMAISRIEMYC